METPGPAVGTMRWLDHVNIHSQNAHGWELEVRTHIHLAHNADLSRNRPQQEETYLHLRQEVTLFQYISGRRKKRFLLA